MKVPDKVLQAFERKLNKMPDCAAHTWCEMTYDGLKQGKVSWAYHFHLSMNPDFSRHVPQKVVAYMQEHADLSDFRDVY